LGRGLILNDGVQRCVVKSRMRKSTVLRQMVPFFRCFLKPRTRKPSYSTILILHRSETAPCCKTSRLDKDLDFGRHEVTLPRMLGRHKSKDCSVALGSETIRGKKLVRNKIFMKQGNCLTAVDSHTLMTVTDRENIL
jgi:hypothetical protein